MNIGARLETIGHLVPPGSSLADIGTDHAYLPVWCIKNGIVDKAIAADIAAGPCRAATETVAAYGLRKAIEVRQGNGLMALTPGEVATVVIAGMGGTTMIEILEQSPQVAAALKTLVLQPMIGGAALRAWACSHGWAITKEALALEGERLYEIIVLEPATSPMELTALEAQVGPYLLATRPPLFKQQVQQLANHYAALLEKISHSEAARATDKYKEFSRLYKELEVLLHGS